MGNKNINMDRKIKTLICGHKIGAIQDANGHVWINSRQESKYKLFRFCGVRDENGVPIIDTGSYQILN